MTGRSNEDSANSSVGTRYFAERPVDAGQQADFHPLLPSADTKLPVVWLKCDSVAGCGRLFVSPHPDSFHPRQTPLHSLSCEECLGSGSHWVLEKLGHWSRWLN
jgi:hypothetical protein